ncbi:MAG: hypothetical protein IT555_13455 [Acetobacteraceae bacterium]|nr:hypothetical protein [Acetobacteraceae bacterium]
MPVWARKGARGGARRSHADAGFGRMAGAAGGPAPGEAGAAARVDGGAGSLGRRGCGQDAGLPEADDVFQAGEQAAEAGHQQGMQRIGQPEGRLVRRDGGTHARDLVGQEGW